ncbi:MAG: hypothetical protein J6333_12940 [Planctomycetes bacterium]|nr:hypothetical protein [Planctomycetota bacterium]
MGFKLFRPFGSSKITLLSKSSSSLLDIREVAMAGFSYAGHEKNKCQTCQNSQSPINLPRAGAVAGARGGARRGDDGYIGVSLLRPGGAIAARAWRFNQCLCQNLLSLFFCLDEGRALIKKTCKTPENTGDFASWAMVFFVMRE